MVFATDMAEQRMKVHREVVKVKHHSIYKETWMKSKSLSLLCQNFYLPYVKWRNQMRYIQPFNTSQKEQYLFKLTTENLHKKLKDFVLKKRETLCNFIGQITPISTIFEGENHHSDNPTPPLPSKNFWMNPSFSARSIVYLVLPVKEKTKFGRMESVLLILNVIIS